MTRLARGFTNISTLGIIAVAVMLVLFVVVWLKPSPKPIPPREQTSIDSLAATKPHYDTLRIETVRVETLSVVRSAQNARQAIAAQHVADSLHQVAIDAQQAAESAGEQSSRWFTVAEVRRVENDSLRSANGSLTIALADQTTARIAADTRATAAEQRRAATQDLADRLAKDLKHGDCRIAWLLDCPSRKASAVGGAAIDEAVRFVIGRRK